MAGINAELPDGTILNFPEGTPDDVIDATVRKALSPVNDPLQDMPRAPRGMEPATQTARNMLSDMMGRDPSVSQQGISDFGLRAEVSKGDTPREQEMILRRAVGDDGVSRDKFGNLIVTPQGASRLGIATDKPIRFDEPYASFSDIADITGDLPAILGGAAGATVAGPLGFLAGIGGAGMGAMGGKGFGESVEAIEGQNLQSPQEVAKDVAVAGAEGAAGEAIYSGILAPLGRKILAPSQSATGLGDSAVRPGAQELRGMAEEVGVTPKLSNLVDRPILNRLSGMIDTVFGDINASRNSSAINSEIRRMREEFNTNVDSSVDLGELIKADIKEARREFGDQARAKFALVDTVLKGKPIVETFNVRARATEILNSLPKDADGSFIGISKKEIDDLQRIANLPELQTVENMQALRGVLFDRMETGTLTPGVRSRDASMLVRSLSKDLDETIASLPRKTTDPADLIPHQQALEQLKTARDFYRDGIKKFEDATINRIAKDEEFAGSIAPERIVDLMFRKGNVTPIDKVFNVISDDRKRDIQSHAMSKILDEISTVSPDPLEGAVFDGTKFLGTLDSYGEETLKAMFGPEATKDLYRLGKVIQSASRVKGKTSGALAAASIALNPLQNIPKLVKLRIMGKIMSSKQGMRWMMEGVEAYGTRESAAALARISMMAKQMSDDYSIGSGFQEQEDGR